MKFYEDIQNLNDEELEKLVKERIEELEKEDKEDCGENNVIGFELDYNPYSYNLTGEEEVDFNLSCLHPGYISKGTKIVYGFCIDGNGIVSNNGNYYYVDTDDYLLEFCKFIKDKELASEYDLFDYILEFIKDYMGGYFNSKNRDQLFKMLYKGYMTYHDPGNEHYFSTFEGTGGGMCTEYSLMAQNILSLFDVDSYFIVGREKTDGEKEESHAFNIVTYTNVYGAEVNYLVDFANHVRLYDINYNVIDNSPYVAVLDQFEEEDALSLINGDRHYIFEDYDYILVGDTLIQLSYEANRDYYVPDDFLGAVERSDINDRVQHDKGVSR